MKQLSEIRSNWHNSFLRGEVEILKAIEMPSFKAVNEFGIECGDARYSTISKKVSDGRWFKSSVYTTDVNLEFLLLGNTCYVTGLGEIRSIDSVIRRVFFSEIWIKINDVWKINQIHTSNAKI
ncbi:nuclear transport factor 2 family protein [Vibrio sp. B1-2]|uniref:nuclear transport factor 2 family protein n=1 Tax=Vibrio sp. B1-2 TaxID=2591465 RepID=UPI001482EECF|nr:nuclear transport factor 2 family protein [Vibrio sp. B1-2]NNO00747.1 nuclear transport factor 2 family protein [Vibrio sp. B1-2]